MTSPKTSARVGEGSKAVLVHFPDGDVQQVDAFVSAQYGSDAVEELGEASRVE